MHIDYDGLRHDMLSQVEDDQRNMLQHLLEAMVDGEVPTCSVTIRWEICPTCEGEGGHSRHLGVIDPEAWSEWDDDDREGYLSGRYDRSCDRCGGDGKVREIDREVLPEAVRAWLEGYERDAWESARITYAERLAGC